MDTCTLIRGDAPLLISLPHDGSEIPAAIAARMSAAGRRVADTDWHVGRLYAFAAELGASLLQPRYSRYVIDLNRPPDGAALYPGQRETGLCPLRTFADEPIYGAGLEPDSAEIHARREHYWQPYHDALQTELQRLRRLHGRVVLWEGHSIRSQVPMLFSGRLPDLNLGTADGHSCSRPRHDRLTATLASQNNYSWIVDGRFKGGYITRHYGQPEASIDAVQLELAQLTYMNEDRFEYDPVRAERLIPLLRTLLERCL